MIYKKHCNIKDEEKEQKLVKNVRNPTQKIKEFLFVFAKVIKVTDNLILSRQNKRGINCDE